MDTHNGLYVSEPPVITLVDDPAHRRFKARASFVLNDAFRFRVKVIRLDAREPRAIVSFPSFRHGNGFHLDLVHPIDQAARDWIEGVVLRAYGDELARRLERMDAARPVLVPPDDEPFHTPRSSCGHPTEEVLFEMHANV